MPEATPAVPIRDSLGAVSQYSAVLMRANTQGMRQDAARTVSFAHNERIAMEAAINSILLEMQPFLESSQLKRLRDALKHAFEPKRQEANKTLLQAFLTAKEVEGCSLSTLRYYEDTLTRALVAIGKPIGVMVSDDLRQYLNDYEVTRHTSKVTIDNIRRIMSSFFSWLEDEDYIVKSPMRRIRRVKTAQVTREVFSDEELEALRGACESKRDLAMVDLLASTGMRVGELVRLNKGDINFHERECLVMG